MAAKGGYKLPGLNKALRVVDTLGKQMTGEANADYAVALSALKAGQAGLSNQTRGLTRDLLAGVLTQNAKLSTLAKRARAEQGVVDKHQQATTNRYGSALGESVASSYKTAAAVAAGTAAVLTGAAKAGKATTRTAETVAGIAQSGVAAQQAAAKYGLSQALQQRSIIDSQTLAGLTGQLYQTALQYNAQMSMYEQQRQDALKDAKKAAALLEKQQGEALTAQVNALITQGSDLSMQASNLYGEWQQAQYALPEDQRTPFSVGDTVATWSNQAGYSLESPEAAVFAATLRGVSQGQMPTDAFNYAMTSLYGSQPGWDQWGSKALAAGMANIQAQTIGQFADTLASAPATDSGGGFLNKLDNSPASGYMEAFAGATVKTGNPIGALWYLGSGWLADQLFG